MGVGRGSGFLVSSARWPPLGFFFEVRSLNFLRIAGAVSFFFLGFI